MPRKPRQPSQSGIYHWITRGMHRRALFHFNNDYKYFLQLTSEHSKNHGIRIFHYCLMPNHVHMLIQAPDIRELSYFSHFVKRRYAYYHSKTTKHQGASFERMYKSIPVEKDSYLLECARYIERNPVRANLADHPSRYDYSSYPFYALGQENALLTPSPGYLALANDDVTRKMMYIEYLAAYRPQEEYASKDKFES